MSRSPAFRGMSGGAPIEGEQKGESPAFTAGKGQAFPTCPAVPREWVTTEARKRRDMGPSHSSNMKLMDYLLDQKPLDRGDGR